MAEVIINIDNIAITCQEGEYILDVARKNGIYIPAICYLNRCSPTLACRLCLVEIDGKQAYACNAKAKAGMNIVTESEEIRIERRSIMEVYDVNHPLECGICDKSGECELQNNTLEQGIDRQGYCIPDTHRKVQYWNFIKYDASLCIVCERCVTACNDGIGDNALKTVPRGSIEIDKNFKETMPKNAYAIWNKMNKSLIGPSGGKSTLDCTMCGECIAVCPVGALTSPLFTYLSNAWELKKVVSSCPHCSSGCQLIYEVKHSSINNTEEKIYRVTNEWNFQSLCGAGRFGFDYSVKGAKTKTQLDKAVFALRKADTIAFDSIITNEDALLLQKLKESKGYRLICPEAKALQEFIEGYGGLWNGTIKTLRSSNFIISVGSALVTDNPEVRYAMNNGIKMNKGAALYFHPIEDKVIANLGKNILSLRNKIESEEYVLALLVDLFVPKNKLSQELSAYLQSFHSLKTVTVDEKVKEKIEEKIINSEGVEEIVYKEIEKNVTKEIEVDENQLYDLIGLSHESENSIKKLLEKKDSFSLIIGEDCLTHHASKNIARWASLLEHYANFNVVVIPPKTNTLGVALLCDLDEEKGEYTVGYNTVGDFILSGLESGGENILNIAPILQQKGSLTTIDKRVVPLSSPLQYEGYNLSDVCKALLGSENMPNIQTESLPKSKGYKSTSYALLSNEYLNDGTSLQGYMLETVKVIPTEPSLPLAPLSVYQGQIAYQARDILDFNQFTQVSKNLNLQGNVGMSSSLYEALEMTEGENVVIDNTTYTVYKNSNILGNIVYMTTFKNYGYRFKMISLEKGKK